jgi:hypothetical protein
MVETAVVETAVVEIAVVETAVVDLLLIYCVSFRRHQLLYVICDT